MPPNIKNQTTPKLKRPRGRPFGAKNKRIDLSFIVKTPKSSPGSDAKRRYRTSLRLEQKVKLLEDKEKAMKARNGISKELKIILKDQKEILKYGR